MSNPTSRQLERNLLEGTLILFIGADLPRAITGLPSRQELAERLALSYSFRPDLSLAQVTQRMNRFEFTEFMRQELDTRGKEPPEFYKNIAKMVVTHCLPALVTTAYDNHLERALDEMLTPFDRVVCNADLSLSRPNRPMLIKLYGDFQSLNTLVVNEDDHYALCQEKERKSVLNEVKALFYKNTVLFLGYDLSDYDFNLLWREVLEHSGSYAHLAYAVWPDVSNEEQYMWRDRGIITLETDPWGLTQPSEKLKARLSMTPSSAKSLFGAGNRWAVLVGVNSYTDPLYPPLHVCVKDVEAIHAQLIKRGFDPARIHLLTDNTDPLPTRAEIFSSLEQAAKAAQRDDLVLFYYSGHGDLADGVSYLVAREGKPHALKHTAAALSDVVDILEKSQARAKVIILDACHSGANFEGKGPKTMPPDFIERVFEQAKGQVILASCEQGQVSHEWQAQERSVFTHFLLEALQDQAYYDEKGFVTVQDVNRHVTNGVTLWAFQHKRTQTPTLQGKMAGDIILVRKE